MIFTKARNKTNLDNFQSVRINQDAFIRHAWAWLLWLSAWTSFLCYFAAEPSFCHPALCHPQAPGAWCAICCSRVHTCQHDSRHQSKYARWTFHQHLHNCLRMHSWLCSLVQIICSKCFKVNISNYICLFLPNQKILVEKRSVGAASVEKGFVKIWRYFQPIKGRYLIKTIFLVIFLSDAESCCQSPCVLQKQKFEFHLYNDTFTIMT